jgi:hypothetical protein
MKLEFSRQIFEKVSNIEFHQNPFSGSRIVPMRTDRRTDMTKQSLCAILRTRLKSVIGGLLHWRLKRSQKTDRGTDTCKWLTGFRRIRRSSPDAQYAEYWDGSGHNSVQQSHSCYTTYCRTKATLSLAGGPALCPLLITFTFWIAPADFLHALSFTCNHSDLFAEFISSWR